MLSSLQLVNRELTTGYSEVLNESLSSPSVWTTSMSQNHFQVLDTSSRLSNPGLRFLTPDEQDIFDRALRRSVKIVSKGRRK